MDERRPGVMPVGTQAVVRASGAVCVVISAPGRPDGVYLVRFPDGTESRLRADELGVRKHLHRDGVSEAGPPAEVLWEHVIYRCVVGSRAYGLSREKSDTDLRGIYLPPADLHWSLAGVPEQLENRETDEVYWELQKFVALALKANPNVLECLYTPIVDHATPPAKELLAMRSAFVSRMVYQTYNGYAMSQFQKMQRHHERTGEPNLKHAMHLIRLLLSGVAALRTGEIQVDVSEYRESLLAIRRGELSAAGIDEWRLALHREFDEALTRTRLPEMPDYERANAFLIRARRGAL